MRTSIALFTTLAVIVPLSAASTVPSYDDYVDRQDSAIAAARDDDAMINFVASSGFEFQAGQQVDRLLAYLETVKRDPGALNPLVTDSILNQKLAELAVRLKELMVDYDTHGNGSVVSNSAVLTHTMFYPPYILHRYRGTVPWTGTTNEAVRSMVADSPWQGTGGFGGAPENFFTPYLGAHLFAGEAVPDADLLETGLDLLHLTQAKVARLGAVEVHAPHYGHLQWSFLAPLSELDDLEAAAIAKSILAYTMLVDAHLYLPGGGLGMPQPRGTRSKSTHIQDPPTSEVQHLHSRLNLFVGDPALVADATLPLPIRDAVTDFAVPEIIRSIFLHKGNGYEFFVRERHRAGNGPAITYPVGWQGSLAVPWQTVSIAGGRAQMGAMYGNPMIFGRDASFAAYVYDPAGGFDILAHIHPAPPATNSTLLDYGNEMRSYRRMMRGGTLITLWDASNSTYPYTQAHVPGWVWHSAMTVPSGTAHDWRVGLQGDVILAFLPLGAIDLQNDQDGGDWRHLELEALSGSIVELASLADFQNDINVYLSDLATREVVFGNADATNLFAEVIADTGEKIRLDYATDTRSLDTGNGLEDQGLAYLRHGMMESPFVVWDENTLDLTVTRTQDGYTDIVYDFGDPSFPTPPYGLKLGTSRTLASEPLHLKWSKSSDVEGIDRYELFQIRNGGETIVQVPSNLITENGKAHDVNYQPATSPFVETATYFVKAVDTTGQVSRKSNKLVVANVAGDGEPPTQPGITVHIESTTQITLTWLENDATDNDAVSGYELFRDNQRVSTQAEYFYNDHDVVENQQYTYEVRAFDPSGNLGPKSDPVVATAKTQGGGGACGLVGLEPVVGLVAAYWIRRRGRRAVA